MERLPKFAIYLAIAIGVIIFTLFLYSILPHIIENSSRDWDRALGNNMTEEELKKLFYAEPAYGAFKEKYPDSDESFENRHRGDGRMYLTMYNYTNLNEVKLRMDYDTRDSKVDVEVNCKITNPIGERDLHREVSGSGSVGFIEKMDCLNTTHPISFSTTTDCGPGTLNLENGVCIIKPILD